MPYSPAQRRAIAAKMKREGKSPKQISDFFHKHGHPGKGKTKKKR